MHTLASALLVLALVLPAAQAAETYANDHGLKALGESLVQAIVDNDKPAFTAHWISSMGYGTLTKQLPEGAELPDRADFHQRRTAVVAEAQAAGEWFDRIRTAYFHSTKPKSRLEVAGVIAQIHELPGGVPFIDSLAVDVAITRAHGVRLHFGEAVKLKDGWRFVERPSDTVTKRRHTATGDTVEDEDLGE